MTDGAINRRILKAVSEFTDDADIREFLKELLFLEAERKGQWRWKEVYRSKIEQFTGRRQSGRADQ